jgi:hypothetical protein
VSEAKEMEEKISLVVVVWVVVVTVGDVTTAVLVAAGANMEE